MIGTAMVKKQKDSGADPAGRMMRAVRKAETSEFDRKRGAIKDAVQDVGTGQTILKMRARPIPKLVDEGKLGPEELQAAEDILTAFTALSSGLCARGINYDRVDNGRHTNSAWPTRVARAVTRYQEFARIWTQRNNEYGDPTLAILIGAIVDQHWLRTLALDHCRGQRMEWAIKRTERAIIGGLRDYAARAGFVSGQQADKWQAEAQSVFAPVAPELRKAMRRAAVER